LASKGGSFFESVEARAAGAKDVTPRDFMVRPPDEDEESPEAQRAAADKLFGLK